MTPEYPLPEFTRSLRALAVPSAPGSDHDVVFTPLIEARRAAQRATSLEQQLTAFDGTKLDRAWRGSIVTLAERKQPRTLPDRRALAAELELLATPLWTALRDLDKQAAVVRAASADAKRAAWEQWIEQVRRVFRAADEWWESSLPALADPRGRRGVLWRRVLGGGQ
jgi:hypothetical protein